MPRQANGQYILPTGNPVVPDTLITSAWANPTMSDIGNALSDSLSRSGLGGMTAPLGIVSGNVGQPGLAFVVENSLGFYRSGLSTISLGAVGVRMASFSPAGLDVVGALGVSGAINATGAIHSDAALSGVSLLTSGAGTSTITGRLDVLAGLYVTGAMQNNGVAVVTEAPVNGTTYGRKDAAWALLPASVAPSDLTGMIAWRHSAGGKWLQLNGQTVSKVTYAALWAYGQNFLTVNQAARPGLYLDVDASSFKVPNLSGLFVRGLGTSPGTGYTSDVLGALQLDALQDHVHPINPTTNNIFNATGGTQGPTSGPLNLVVGSIGSPSAPARISTETRTANVALVPCVFAG
jgi:hypothetical protein